MNSVRCSNCGFENPPGMAFCTNCGNSLTGQNANPVFPRKDSGSSTLLPNAQPVAKKGGFGKNAAIFGGIGCLALLLGGGIALFGLLYYIGSNEIASTNTNYNQIANNATVANRNSVNRNASINSNVEANIRSSDGGAPSDNAATASDEQEMRALLSSQIGQYEQQGEIEDGNATEDYPGADKIVKSMYAKKNKKVAVILAKFSSPAAAKSSFGYFLGGFKSAGAKIAGQQKVRNKNGVETGELAFYSYKNVHETMFYADKYGFRIVAPDRQSLVEFVRAFSSYVSAFNE